MFLRERLRLQLRPLALRVHARELGTEQEDLARVVTHSSRIITDPAAP